MIKKIVQIYKNVRNSTDLYKCRKGYDSEETTDIGPFMPIYTQSKPDTKHPRKFLIVFKFYKMYQLNFLIK